MNRVAFITGAGSNRGIGRATAVRLARNGWDIVITDITSQGLARTAAEIEDKCTGRVLPIECDVTDPVQITNAVTQAQGEFGDIDTLVNNAGISRSTPLLDIGVDEWDSMFAVNVRSTFLFTQALIPAMQRNRFGRIVNLSSVAAKRGGGLFGSSHYSASKAAILGFTRAVAREMAPFGITCNAVAPSMIDTDIFGGALPEERKEALAKDVPVGRIGRPDEVAAAIAFLCSEEASYITGEVMDVNGGMHID